MIGMKGVDGEGFFSYNKKIIFYKNLGIKE